MTSDDRDAAAPPASSSTVLRPSSAAYARALRANLWIAIPLLVISVIRIGLNPWLLPVFLVAIVATFVGVVVYFRTTRIEFGDGRYSVSSWGRTRRFTASDAGVLVTVVALISGSTAPTTPQLILARPDGSRLLRLRGQTWEVAQFTELAHDLIAHGVRNDAILEPITTGALRARYPRLIAWWEAHPIAFGLLLGLGILVAIVVIAVAVVASAH